MVCEVKKLKYQAVILPKTKTSIRNLQEISQQHSIILNQGKVVKITIIQKDLTHEIIPAKTKIKLYGH